MGKDGLGDPLGLFALGTGKGMVSRYSVSFCIVNSQLPHMCPLENKGDIKSFHVGTVWNSLSIHHSVEPYRTVESSSKTIYGVSVRIDRCSL